MAGPIRSVSFSSLGRQGSGRVFIASSIQRPICHSQRSFSISRTCLQAAELATGESASPAEAGAEKSTMQERRKKNAAESVIPFSKLPYQCFQEARKFLAQDRLKRLEEIKVVREEIARLSASSKDDSSTNSQLAELEDELERLIIQADMNDPLVKIQFEDGKGDMNKPIFRYLADKKWRSYRRKIALQRIERMEVIPDVLPSIDPDLDVHLSFSGADIDPGAVVLSIQSEKAPTLTIQSFARKPRTVSVVLVDSDVPNVQEDSFDQNCHFLAVNIPITPTTPTVQLDALDSTSQVVHPWLPPYAQNGTPYHRLSLFVLDQPAGASLDAGRIRELFAREKFSLRDLAEKESLKPSGTFMFRSIWDDNTAAVMERNGIPGSTVVFKRKQPERLPYKKKDSKRYR